MVEINLAEVVPECQNVALMPEVVYRIKVEAGTVRLAEGIHQIDHFQTK
jgi:hypothetical protein